ncbi:hypothetical protein EMIT053CA3_250044 [Pseudomonas donghuensis]
MLEISLSYRYFRKAWKEFKPPCKYFVTKACRLLGCSCDFFSAVNRTFRVARGGALYVTVNSLPAGLRSGEIGAIAVRSRAGEPGIDKNKWRRYVRQLPPQA